MNTFFWDVDGVFVDTERLHFEAWRELFKKIGGSHELTSEEYMHCAGRTSRENTLLLSAIMGIQADYEKINPMRRKIYASLRTSEIPTIARNIALLRTLKKQFQAAKFVAVSAATQREIEENLQAAEVRALFEDTVSFEQDPTIRRKPEPDIYFFALQKHHIKTSDCLAFEDSASGVTAATAAGIRCIALPNNFTKNQNFEKAIFVVPLAESLDVILDQIMHRFGKG